MTALTPQQIAAKWATNLAGATETAKAGAEALTVAPGQLAARQANVWAQNDANSKPKWQRNVAAVSLSDWQAAYTGRGIQRMASGASDAQPKFGDFMNSLLAYQKTAISSLPPRGTYEQNKARAMAWMDKMHQFNYKGGA